MRKVGERVREFVALIKLMTPVGKYRVGILALYVFILLILLGFVFEYLCLGYFIGAVIVVVLYVIALLWWTFNK